MKTKVTKEITLSPEIIKEKIFLIRGKKVMFDRDLAALYEVETRQLNQAVKRNIERFPEDFMFVLNKKEMNNWMSQIVTSNPSIKQSLRKPPMEKNNEPKGKMGFDTER